MGCTEQIRQSLYCASVSKLGGLVVCLLVKIGMTGVFRGTTCRDGDAPLPVSLVS